MEINRTNIFELVNQLGIKPSKDYGQNFLIEPNLSAKIVEALGVKDDDKVIEIGPGLGALTHFLCDTKADITAVDIDYQMTSFLKSVYKDIPNLNIVENDIRLENVAMYNKVIGNIPYNITTEIIQYFLLNANKAETMVFMIQVEALNRFIDVSGKEYGPTSVLIHLLGKIEKLFIVRAGSFYPAPKCHSVVFRININPKTDKNKATAIYKMCKQLFANRRKTILNNLLSFVNNKDEAVALCENLKLNTQARPEDLSPQIYNDIYEYLNK